MPARRKQAGALGVFFQKSSWSEFGRSLKRMHKDRRARKQLFGLALLLLIPLLIIVVSRAFMIGSGAWLFLPLSFRSCGGGLRMKSEGGGGADAHRAHASILPRP